MWFHSGIPHVLLGDGVASYCDVKGFSAALTEVDCSMLIGYVWHPYEAAHVRAEC